MKLTKLKTFLYYSAFTVFSLEYIFWDFQDFFNIPSTIAVILISLSFLLSIKKYSLKELVLSFAIIIASTIVYITSKDASLLKLSLFLASSKDIDFKKLVKYDFWLKLSASILVLMLYSMNMVPDVRIWVGSTLKHSLGFSHPNTLGTIVFFLIADYYYAFNRKITILNSLIVFSICYFVLSVPHARTAVYAILFLYFGMCVYNTKVYEKIFNNPFIKFLTKNFFTIVAVITLISTILYVSGSTFGEQLNSSLSNRLNYINIYHDMYGLTLLGNDFNGFWNRLNTLDNVYAYILFRYGIIAFISIALMFKKLMSTLQSKKQYILIIIFLVLFLYGISENGWLKVSNNIYMLSMAALIFPKHFIPKENKKEGQNTNAR